MLIGNLGADPEVRYMQNGDAVTNIRLATSRRWKDKQTNEQREATEWHRVTFFNIGNFKLANIAGEYLKKGSKAYVEGRIQTRKWQDNTGQDRYTTEIIADQMQMLDSRSEGTANFTQQGDYSASQPQQNLQQPQATQPFNQTTSSQNFQQTPQPVQSFNQPVSPPVQPPLNQGQQPPLQPDPVQQGQSQPAQPYNQPSSPVQTPPVSEKTTSPEEVKDDFNDDIPF